MPNQSKQCKQELRIIELPHHSSQPIVAELNEDVRLDVTFEELVKAVLRPAKIRYVKPRNRDPQDIVVSPLIYESLT